MKKIQTYAIFMMVMALSIVGVSADGHKMNKMSMYSANPGMANVRAIHLSPNAPNVDIWVNGANTVQNVTFGQNSGFLTVPSDMYNFQVVPTTLTEPVVIEADLQLDKRKDYTIVAVNTLDKIEAIVLSDWSFYFNKYQAKVRFVHASADAPAVDIALKDGPVVFSNVEFKEASDYKRLKGGEYDLEVRLAGTDTVVLDLPGVMVEEGTSYTVFAKGLVTDGTLDAMIVVDRSREDLGGNKK